MARSDLLQLFRARADRIACDLCGRFVVLCARVWVGRHVHICSACLRAIEAA